MFVGRRPSGVFSVLTFVVQAHCTSRQCRLPVIRQVEAGIVERLVDGEQRCAVYPEQTQAGHQWYGRLERDGPGLALGHLSG